MPDHLFCFNVVGLSPALLDKLVELPAFSRLSADGGRASLTPVCPALTIPAQATLATGTTPDRHGLIANGLFHRDRLEVSFWDQYRSLLREEPFWETLKKENQDFTAALLFWQLSLFGGADIIVTPKPLHTEEGMVQWCYSKPVGLYEELTGELGGFALRHFWGPLASPESSRWIMAAAVKILERHRPNLMLVYLPLLDYSCQRLGPDSPQVTAELRIIDDLVGTFLEAVDRAGLSGRAAFSVFSEYSMTGVSDAVDINRVLREEGFLAVREIEGHEYLDLEMSRAFAMVDHQVAHIYTGPDTVHPVRELLEKTEGIARLLNREEQRRYRLGHDRSGDLVAFSQPDRWFSYYWWLDPAKAPGFSHTVDIHRKPGYDPLELFFDREKRVIPQDTSLIRGSHGLPPDAGGGEATLLVSGPGRPELPDSMAMTGVAPLLRGMLKN